jgi:hypothetical protein
LTNVKAGIKQGIIVVYKYSHPTIFSYKNQYISHLSNI